MLEFKQNGDDRGYLVVCEGGGKDIPFDIKRIFYIYESDKDVKRGQQAIFTLNRPHTGIYIPKMVWKDMYDFSEDSVLLCLASEHYKPEEYIRDYDEFLKIVQEEDE